MTNDSPNNNEKEFVVVYRASSASIFEPNNFLRVNFPFENKYAVLTFRTRYKDLKLEHPLPGDLWVDARGRTSSLEKAAVIFGKAATGILNPIAFSTNAAIGDLDLELAFENTPSISKRPFLQSMLPDEWTIINIRRIINVEMTRSLMDAIQKHSEKERIIRAINQYNLALRFWRAGYETLATEHLFLGVEALTKAIIRHNQTTLGLNKKDFAKKLGIEVDKLDPYKSLDKEILTYVRRNILFKGDTECHQKAKKASDGLEHGFLPYDEIHDSAAKVRDKTASYLRDSIIELLELDQETRSFYMDKSKKKPLGNWPMVKYIRGYLVGESNDLAAEGNEYPILSWRSRVKSIKKKETGEYSISFDEKMTVRIGNNIQFQPESFEVWRP